MKTTIDVIIWGFCITLSLAALIFIFILLRAYWKYLVGTCYWCNWPIRAKHSPRRAETLFRSLRKNFPNHEHSLLIDELINRGFNVTPDMGESFRYKYPKVPSFAKRGSL